ncbi:hypothetical protein [Tepidibacter mesophilus]|uniref:hypothetical protein n=1 Tax=Tepidibacter mesophilus TaxID=655607 RepID=UPI000C083DAB|nr:hypothetical protein [Tepidibacter mesophilus]
MNKPKMNQTELQNAKENMNTNKNPNSGSMLNNASPNMGAFQNSTSIKQAELEYAKRKVQESGTQNPLS